MNSEIRCIDINSDMGESYGAWCMGDDNAMLDIVTSANVACGFHAGDPAGISDTLQAAGKRNVVIGAHVSYHDIRGFGRRNMDVPDRELIADVIYQIGALQALAQVNGLTVKYVKPHGALYNTIANDRRQADCVIRAILMTDPNLKIMVLAGSPIVNWAKEAGLSVISEAFADRAYNPDGTLLSRTHAGAVLHNPDEVARRVVHLAKHGQVKAVDGSWVKMEAQSVCVHSDSPGAVQMARAIRTLLKRNAVNVSSFFENNLNL
ncbi:LamB/YcsF family protein (plasmid) [Pantoea dispersa]|nr:LamB/YcsF family protein [Pantoea dispersa]